MTVWINQLTQIIYGSDSATGNPHWDAVVTFMRPTIIIVLGVLSSTMAWRAKKNTEAVGNGFATHTKDSLTAVLSEMKDQTNTLSRIERRQDAHARRLKTVEVRLDRLSDGS